MAKKVTLRSSDHKTFEVEEAVVFQSQTIKEIIQKPAVPLLAYIPLPNVRADILAKVIEYCKKQVDKSSTKKEDDAVDREDLDAEFFKVDLLTLCDLLCAANQLQIQSLLDQTSQTIADQVRSLGVF
ncbi:hypothetical protein AQUCO_10000015v1 [Aquilegia coerulea]|uniref:SKP1-like protein n=1 Tax=Aquilegia coerulea TaxID=218851 RepID=A0A2G5C482_AQUCA|nr:hypothetical protein AQUCO_10000015v1 [Aquilegia coerulea]